MFGPEQESPAISRVFHTRGETRAFYNKIADYYDLLSEHSEAPVRAAALDVLEARAGERILEIGCGTGHSTAELGRFVGPAGRVFAFDLSERMLARTVDLATRREVATLVCPVSGDALQLPFRNACMDAVLLSFTLELFDTEEIPAVLAECRRVLKPEGRIAVAGMSKEGPGGLVVQVYEWSHRHFPNFIDCRPIFVGRALESAGFRLLKRQLMEIWLPVEVVLAARGAGGSSGALDGNCG